MNTPPQQCSGVEAVAKALAQADGLIFDEVCGYETEAQECDSSTCVAAHYEDHDPDWARTIYLRHATAAIAAIDLTAHAQALLDAGPLIMTREEFNRICAKINARAKCREIMG